MRDRGVGPDIDARAADHGGQFRPFELAVETHDVAVVPDVVEIGAIAAGAGDDGAEAALAQRRGELAPAVGGPALVGEHRRGMHDGVGMRRRESGAHRAGGTDDLGVRGNADQLGEPQNIENAMLVAIADIGAAERESA